MLGFCCPRSNWWLPAEREEIQPQWNCMKNGRDDQFSSSFFPWDDSVANLNVEVFQHQMSTALSFWCCNNLDENHFPHIKATQKAMAPMGFWLEQIFGTRCKPLPILVAKHSSPAGFFILLLWDPKTMVNFPKNYQTRGSISISWEGQCFPLSSLQKESS